MATYTKLYTLDLSDGGDFVYNAIDKLEDNVDQLVTDLNNAHTTTRGDIIYKGASAVSRLAKGSANQWLVGDGNDPYWQGATTTLTGDAAAADTTHDVILLDGTSATVTLTLPAVTAAKTYMVKCINLGNTCDIACNGSETIEGITTYHFVTVNQAIIIRGDTTPGTNTWRILAEHIPAYTEQAEGGANNALTGTTDETVIETMTIPGNALRAGDIVYVKAVIENTGANDTKTHDFNFGGFNYVVHAANNNAEQFLYDIQVHMQTTSAERILIHGVQDDDSPDTTFATAANSYLTYQTGSVDSSSAVAVSFAGTLANASDSITVRFFSVQIVRGTS